MVYRGVAQLVARLVRVQEAVGSTPATPTMGKSLLDLPIFLVSRNLIGGIDCVQTDKDIYKKRNRALHRCSMCHCHDVSGPAKP